MKLLQRSATYNFEEFCQLIPDGQKADLIDGEIYMASPDNTDAYKLSFWLSIVIALFVQVKKLGGEVLGSRVAFRLDGANGPEPDIGYVQKGRVHLIKRGYVDGPPDLAIEIVSPESVERDYEKKRKQYEQAGVPEYWIIDEDMRKVTLLRLDARGKYREVRPKKGILRSQVIPEFWLRIEWLWLETRPETLDALDQILGKDHGHTP
jgi:Uma2 family endonuclease